MVAVAGTWVLAHQGGWDEMLMVAAPIGLFAGLLWLANRRAEAKVREDAAAAEQPDPTDPGPPDPTA